MPPATETNPPSVPCSFANSFWGKDDAGVTPLLDRMHNAKETCDQLKNFYSARAALEDEYARKLLALAKKPLGSGESGTLRMSLDVVKREVEEMGKAHQNIASQMKTELDEPLAAFTGAMKERRKIVQGGIEKLLKLKLQQTAAVNKSRDRYEADCLKIKAYLAQGNMVMGQEERKIHAKLEKTKIQVSSTSNDYEAAIKSLEEVTGRWNKDWKIACDKFQNLEEERIDFLKNNLWAFANIASTVCVSDDASYEKIRLSLEDCEVEKDIASFIQIHGTGQVIPDPPKFIDFCRGDVADDESNAEDNANYSVAQFSRQINPAHRTSSPQPSLLESHHDPNSNLANELRGGRSSITSNSIQNSPSQEENIQHHQAPKSRNPYGNKAFASSFTDVPKVPHNEYPENGMTQFCRTGPPSSIGAPSTFAPSDLGSNISSNISRNRPESRESFSDYSATELSSSQRFTYDNHSSAGASPIKETIEDNNTPSKKSRASWIKSPFRKSGKPEKDSHQPSPQSASRNTWGSASAGRKMGFNNAPPNENRRSVFGHVSRSNTPEPVDPTAQMQLNVGNNVFDVSTDKGHNRNKSTPALSRGPPSSNMSGPEDPYDPLVQALDELNRVTSKVSKSRNSADQHFQIPSPAPPQPRNGRTSPLPGAVQTPLMAAQRGTPPPSYDSPNNMRSTLSAPPAAHTAREMQNTTSRYVTQRRNGYESPSASRGQAATSVPRARSPAPERSRSPNPAMQHHQHHHQGQGQGQYRPPSSQGYHSNGNPRPLSSQGFRGGPGSGPGSNTGTPTRPGGYGASHHAGSPGTPGAMGGMPPRGRSPQPPGGGGGGGMNGMPARARSPQPGYAPHQQQQQHSHAHGYAPGHAQHQQPHARPGSSLALQVSRGGSAADDYHHSHSRGSGGHSSPASGQRARSKSSVGIGQYSKDGRPILHHARAMYSYQPQIPEEMGFAKGDMLAVLRLQDDGWWEAEVVGKPTRGLVPSNYLQVAER